MYVGDDRFYRFIDVVVTEVFPDKSVVFVYIGGHPTLKFEDTWDPAALGPFKQLLGDKIKDHRE